MGSWELRNGKAILPEGYAKIENGKYEDCINLTSIVLPESVTEIGNSAFWGCENLKEIVFSDAITSVGDCAFYNCKNLKKVVLPKSLKTIGSSVFAGCENLKEIVIPDSVTSIGKELFGNNTFGEITVFKNGTAKDANGTVFKVKDSGMMKYDICDALKSIYCYVKDPNQIKLSPDSELNGYQATLYVPAGSVGEYKMKRPWNKFAAIKEIPGTVKEKPVQENSPLRSTSNFQNNINNKTMTKKLIPEELDLLIQECLTDGILTPKEREIILRKAEKLGLDRDEIDIYLDAQVQKIDQETEATIRRRKGTSCPFCGAFVQQLTDKCPKCGRDITPEATEELEEILDNLESALIKMKSKRNFDENKAIVERYTRKARLYYSNHPKIKILLAEVDVEMANAEKEYKSARRKEVVSDAVSSVSKSLSNTIASVLKSKWVWGAMPIVIGIIFLWIEAHNDDPYGPNAGVLGAIGMMIFIPGGVIGLIIMFFLQNKKK